MLHVEKQLVNFFPRLPFFNEFSNILNQLASSLGHSGGAAIRALQGAC